MLHRCAFDARSSVALSAHPWNLPYHSRVSSRLLSPSNFPSIFLPISARISLARRVRIFSLGPLPLNSFPENRLPSQTHNIIHFIFHATFSSRQLFLLFRKVGEEKFFRCAAFGMEWKKVVFSLFRERRKIYSKIREQQQSLKKYFKVNENIAADVMTAIDGNRKETRLALQMTSRFSNAVYVTRLMLKMIQVSHPRRLGNNLSWLHYKRQHAKLLRTREELLLLVMLMIMIFNPDSTRKKTHLMNFNFLRMMFADPHTPHPQPTLNPLSCCFCVFPSTSK